MLIDVTTLRRLDDGFDTAGMHTPAYTAPEVLAAPNQPRSLAADAYALGALTVFCLTGRDPADRLEQTRSDLLAVVAAAGVADPGAFVSLVTL